MSFIGGTPGSEVLTGTSGDDTINGGGGNDTVNGNGGNDNIVTGAGSDTIYGGAGNDIIDSGFGDVDLVYGGDGDDILQLSTAFLVTGNVKLYGEAGNDYLYVQDYRGFADITLDGGEGDDRFQLQAGHIKVVGGVGDDLVIQDGDTNAILTLGDGHDVFILHSGVTLSGDPTTILDFQVAGASSDRIDIGQYLFTMSTWDGVINPFTAGYLILVQDGADTLLQVDNYAHGSGYHTLVRFVGVQANTLTAQVLGGFDPGGAAISGLTLVGGDGADTLHGSSGADLLQGGAGNDYLDGGIGADVLEGGDGSDNLVSNQGDDTLRGGDGVDSLNVYRGVSDHADHVLLDGGAGNDGLGIIDNLSGAIIVMHGGDGDDILSIGSAMGATAYGDAGDDTIYAGIGDDVLDGGAGVDTLTYQGASGRLGAGVTVDLSVTTAQNTGVAGWETISHFEKLIGTSFGDTLTGDGADNTISGMDGADQLRGGGGADTLYGGTGDDTLDGGAGVDRMEGGIGDDLYIVDNVGDVVIEMPGTGVDTVQTTVNLTLAENVENLVLLTGAERGVGNDLANTMTGNAGANDLDGAGGADVIDGGYGNDTLHGGAGDDFLMGETVLTLSTLPNSGDDIIDGGDGNDRIFGGAGNDTLLGGAGDDYILAPGGRTSPNGGYAVQVTVWDWGVDTIDGGAGRDWLYLDYTNASTPIVFTMKAPDQSSTVMVGGVAKTTMIGIEDLSFTGGSGNDQLTGGNGFDWLSGGGGDDILIGGGGDDALVGGFGVDILKGGLGNDQYTLSDDQDTIVELAGEGFDQITLTFAYKTVFSIADYANIEGFWYQGATGLQVTAADAGAGICYIGTGSGNDTLIGSTGIDSLTGGAGSDLLLGGLGGDYLDGGAGVDTATYLTAASGVTVNLTLAGQAQNTGGGGGDTLVSIENLTGSGFTDFLTGDAGANALLGMDANDGLSGGGGDDVLDGGAGQDYMVGGTGNDSYVVDNIGDNIVELTGQGVDVVYSSASYTLGANVEVLYLGVAGDLNGVGNSLDNTLIGNGQNNYLSGLAGSDGLSGGDGDDYGFGGDGDDYINGQNGADWLYGEAGFDRLYGEAGVDVLIGGEGADLMVGGLGDDGYVVDNLDDLIQENVGEGTENVYAFVNGYTLAANVENLWLFDAAMTGTGNALANVLVGNTGDNILHGLAGADSLIGGEGSDTLDAGADNDFLAGENGDDMLIGGGGSDLMYGGAGADRFIYTAASDSVSGANMDAILDFQVGIDKVDLSAIVTGADTVSLWANGDGTYVLVDQNSDGVEDMRILLYQTHGVTASDLIL